MDVAMDIPNGLLSPQPRPNTEIISPQLSAKRKRDESSIPDEHLSNGNTKPNGIPTLRQGLQENITDFLQVLQSQDKHAILSRPIEPADDSSEPQAKRQRAESEAAPTSSSATICARAASGKYHSMDDIILDIDIAAAEVSKDLQLPQGSLSKQSLPVPKHEVDLAMEIEWFKKTARELVERQKELDSLRTKSQTNGVSATEKTMANGNGQKPITHLTSKGDGKVVLTLYGNASTPKQLFSSLQNSVHETGVSHPLREIGLPTGITTTHIVPAKQSDLTDEKKRIPTFGELFTPSNSFSLPHPKPSKHATTKSSVVGWYNPSAFENNKPRSSSYFGQPISIGQWLEYNNTSKSPESKRKRRDRTLSLSGKPPPETDHEDDEVKQLETLFRSAYSSFAPTKDETAAVAAEGTVNRIWWRQIGEKSYERFLRNNEHLEGLMDSEDAPKIVEIDENEVNVDGPKDEFDSWVPADMIDPDLQDTPAPKSIMEKETDEVLRDISELLETLNSYQRNRILSPSQLPRPAGSIASADPTTLGATAKPSESEQATYEILKSQLSIMISQLPPYAVAKLNSDQLADLSISTRIPIETVDYKGVMEEDEISARARLASMNVTSTAARAAPATTSYSRTPSTSSLYGNQYGSTSRGGGALAGSYYSQTPVRQPAATVNNLPRPSAPQPFASQGQYSQRQTPATGYRPPATATPTYPHQAPHLSQSYGQSNSPSTYFQQTPQSQRYNQNIGSTTLSGMATSTPQAIMNGRYQPTTHPNYQQRAPVTQNTMNYQYNASNIPRQTSPQKPLPTSYNSAQPSLSQPQRNFSTPTPSQDPARSYFQRQMSNGTPTSQSYTQRPHQATTTNNNGVQNYVSAAGYATVMTDAEQNSILEKQRRQLALQQGTSQYAARAAVQGSLLGGLQNSSVSTGGNGQVDSSTNLSAVVDFNKSTS